MVPVLIILRILHILAAAGLVGSVIFNYFIVRRAFSLIPPAHAVVIGQRIGTEFNYLGWTSMAVLGITGVLRMALDGRLPRIITAQFYAAGSGRAIGLMIISWLVSVASAAAMTAFLRPVLMSKLKAESNPSLADVEKRRTAQLAANQWMGRLQVVSLVFGILAVIGGASAMYGGLF